MTSLTSNGKAVTIKKTFSRETAISIDIKADKSIIWALLTNASDYPQMELNRNINRRNYC